jgi:hypothetical protein
MKKLADIGGAIAAIVFGFVVVNLIHFNFFVVKVVFFSCLIDLLITLVVIGPLVYWQLMKRRNLNKTEIALTGLLASVGLVFYAVIGPTVIDRSLSFYLVEKLKQRGGAIAYDAFPDVFVKEYIPEYRLMDVRLTEQLTSGFAERDGSCVVLTPRGELLAGFLDFYRRNFLPKKRDLMGEITDKLTHPFDNTAQVVDVSCARASVR